MPRIGDLVDVPPIRTVIRLAEGAERPGEIAASFVFTTEVFAHVSVLCESLASGRGQGYFLQGDFGSGKSHFLAALGAWIGGAAGTDDLAKRHSGLARLGQGGRRFLPAAVSLVDYRGSTELESILCGAVAAALRKQPGEWRSENRLDTFRSMLESVRSTGYAGLVLLIDELSEFFRSKPTSQALNEDARTLQLLGELADASPLWIVTAVQESIERTGDLSQAILRKIKDRFPIKLALSTLHIKALISQRLVRRKPGAEEALLRIHERLRQQFPGFRFSFDEFLSLYPVHPKTIALLEGLGGLFSQHRGIVDFVHARIAGDTQRGIPSILDRPASMLLAPDSIYEHFSQRLAEFSAFYVYPRHVVPHLDEVIQRKLQSAEDRTLCRRAVRMLVLYRIHPTASAPTVSELAELASCSIDAHSPDLNARFLAEAILDPVATESPFLARTADPSGDPLKAVYRIVTEEDPGKILAARVARKATEPGPEDSRLLLAPLSRLAETDAWPGKPLLAEGVRRTVAWRGSERKAFLCLLSAGEEKALGERITREFSGDVDFAVIFSIGATAFAAEHTAVWEVRVPKNHELLRDFLASLLVAAELKPDNPAEAPLIAAGQERVARQQPAACQAALDAVYQGEFAAGESGAPTIRVEAAARQLKRFDRLLECAAEVLLDARYPRFREVAPLRYLASARIYQQLLEEFIAPGSLSLSEARARSLGPAIDGLAFPLGLAEIRRNAYIFSPNIAGHALLVFLFSMLRTASATAMEEVLGRLEHGPFGLPRDTALFLLAALAAGGLLSVRRNGRTIPLEHLGLQSVEKAEEVLPGELIGSADRETLLRECDFIGAGVKEESFGLRQQRDAWKEVVKLRDSSLGLIADIRTRASRVSEYSSFVAFDFKSLEAKLAGLETLAQEIKPSLGAKEGLEKFLAAWRGTGLSAGDVEMLRKLDRFLAQIAEQFVFITHYLRHPAVERAAKLEPELARLREEINRLAGAPERGVVDDGGERLVELFSHFRERYVAVYSKLHEEYYRAFEPPRLSKQASRALGAVRLLSSIEPLDRPPGLERFLQELEPSDRACNRHVSEELLRSALCGCGFQPGEAPRRESAARPEELVEQHLAALAAELAGPRVREAIAARAFALQDANPKASQRLGELASSLAAGGASPAFLIDTLDASLCREIEQALVGQVQIRRLSLAELSRRIEGRRLPAERILSLVSEWLSVSAGDAGESGSLIAVEGAGVSPGASADPLSWWRLLHPELSRDPVPGAGTASAVQVAEDLEVRYPSARLAQEFRRAELAMLLRFVATEPFHTQAIRAAWLIVAERVIGGETFPTAVAPDSQHCDPKTAANVRVRLETVRLLARLRGKPYPERLEARLALDALFADAWSTDELRKAAETALGKIESEGAAWISTLEPVSRLRLAGDPLVLLVDGVSADQWLAQRETFARLLPDSRMEWLRLEGEPQTASSVALLFGLSGDPMEVLTANGIPYVQLTGREEKLAAVLSSSPAEGHPALVRIALVDRAAHRSELRLSAMAETLKSLLAEALPRVVTLCRREGRPLVITSDHGLTLRAGRLSHGEGGLFERTICRLTWNEPVRGERAQG